MQNAMTLNLWDGRLTRELQFVTNLRGRFPHAMVKDAAPFIWELRSIKSRAEIDQLRKVGLLGVEAHKAMMRATRAGAPEYEMAAAFEYAAKKAGARDLAYNVIISSAENHPYLYYYRHDRILKVGDFIVVDAGPTLDYYVTDISASNPSGSLYTANDVATITVNKTMDADLFKGVVLSNAQLKGLTELTFDTNVEFQQRASTTRICEDSLLYPKSLVITKADGSIVTAKQIIKITVNPTNVQVVLAKGAFARAAEATNATVATTAYYHFGPGAAVPVRILN